MIPNEILQELRQPFDPAEITYKPGALAKGKEKALGLAYANLRAYQNRLDAVVGGEWEVRYLPWGDKLICELTIGGTTRSSTGEPDKRSERAEIDGTVTEAQAFKRAASAFGLGRYLYEMPNVWAEYDAERNQFTKNGTAALRAEYQRIYDALVGKPPKNGTVARKSALTEPLYALAKQFYGDDHWQSELFRLAEVVSKQRTKDPEQLEQAEVDVLLSGLRKKLAAQEKEDNPFDGELPQRPQDWRQPADAWAWAIAQGAAKDKDAAKELWKALVVGEYGGRLPPSKLGEAFDAFFEQLAPQPA